MRQLPREVTPRPKRLSWPPRRTIMLELYDGLGDCQVRRSGCLFAPPRRRGNCSRASARQPPEHAVHRPPLAVGTRRSLGSALIGFGCDRDLYVMPNRACSTDAELDRPQDAISENGVAHARGSEREPCPGAVELAGYRPRSCRGFSPCRALGSRDIERGRWRRFRANAYAQRLRGPVPMSSRIMRRNLPN
jgi:hypothetical protein